MWIIYIADDLHEMAGLIFSENNKNKKIEWLLGALRNNCSGAVTENIIFTFEGI